MEWMAWLIGATGLGAVVWFGVEVVRLLSEIAQELHHIRKHLQSVSGQMEKISGPLGYVQKLYGLGGRVLGGNRRK